MIFTNGCSNLKYTYYFNKTQLMSSQYHHVFSKVIAHKFILHQHAFGSSTSSVNANQTVVCSVYINYPIKTHTGLFYRSLCLYDESTTCILKLAHSLAWSVSNLLISGFISRSPSPILEFLKLKDIFSIHFSLGLILLLHIYNV